jgi:hypothetical protein
VLESAGAVVDALQQISERQRSAELDTAYRRRKEACLKVMASDLGDKKLPIESAH